LGTTTLSSPVCKISEDPSPSPSPHPMGRGWPSGRVRGIRASHQLGGGVELRALNTVARRSATILLSPAGRNDILQDAGRIQSSYARVVKSLTEHLWFEIPDRRGFVNITSTVEELVRKSEVKEGLCLVNAMHITASVYINDAEDGLLHDYDVWLEKLAPHAPASQYQHNRTGEDNADAHLKRQIMGREVVVAVTKGKLDLGPWEQIFYGEFDGRRRKRVLVKIIGE